MVPPNLSSKVPAHFRSPGSAHVHSKWHCMRLASHKTTPSAFIFIFVFLISALVQTTALAVDTSTELALIDGPGALSIRSPQPYTHWNIGGYAELILQISSDRWTARDSHKPAIDDTWSFSLVREGFVDGFIIAQSTGLQVVPHESDNSIQLSWPIPCWVSPGKYSLMILGGEDEDGLTIQFVPISLQKHAIASRCDVSGALTIENSYVNELNVQIPGKRDLPVQFPNTSSTSGPTSASTSTADITVTAGSSGVTLTPTSLPATIVVEPTETPSSTSPASYPTSSGFSTEYTWTATISGSESVVTVTDTTTTPESITVTMTSLETIVSTTTAPGTTIEFTTTKTMVSTTTMLASASQSSSTGDFLPVNAASPRSPNFTRSLLPIIGAFAAIFLLF